MQPLGLFSVNELTPSHILAIRPWVRVTLCEQWAPQSRALWLDFPSIAALTCLSGAQWTQAGTQLLVVPGEHCLPDREAAVRLPQATKKANKDRTEIIQGCDHGGNAHRT